MNQPEHSLWRAVIERDQAADGLFVYGVHSTRIYCRPTCPSRRPRPAAVSFFPSPDAAERAGYRACQRCRPGEHGHSIESADPLTRVCRAIAAAPAEPWGSRRLARVAGASAATLRRLFRRTLGLTPQAYVAACRQHEFHRQLRRGQSVAAALYASGYGSPSRVYGVRGGLITPAAYRRGAPGVHVSWTTTASPVGRLLVATTAKGLCFVAIGADDAELEAAIEREYPSARLERSRSAPMRRLAAVARAIAGGRPVDTRIPADIAGTAFQWRVWRALTRIPAGQVLTYARLAKMVGHPSAVRAAARACATNPLALIIPCHRVVGADGTLKGYRWGVRAKAALLTREASTTGEVSRPGGFL